jgi:hypothetical protein
VRIIRHSEIVECARYSRELDRGDGSGYSFDCEEDGTVDPATAARIAELLAAEPALRDRGVRADRWHYREPAVGRCACGAEVELGGFTNECDRCGRLYNSGGQELCHPSLWGEETGEHPADILRIA